MTDSALSKGEVQKCRDGEEGLNPVLQVLKVKVLPSKKEGAAPRKRLDTISANTFVWRACFVSVARSTMRCSKCTQRTSSRKQKYTIKFIACL